MPNKLIDLTGKHFGELTVIRRSDKNTKEGKPKWVCQCSCGNIKEIAGKLLRSGQSKSCGRCKSFSTPLFVRSHKNRLYHTWSEMHRRCNGKTANTKYYKDKGISVCDEWSNFDVFATWAISNGYKPTLEIDRIDSDGNYCPNNCRWTTHKQNSRNRKPRSNNNTGIAGVCPRINANGDISYRVTITNDNGRIYLGSYRTIEEAAAVRRNAELKYWGFNIG